MGDNTKSTSKEEEMLEQTFGNYDSELTGEATGSFDTKNSSEKKKGGKSSNKIIYIIVGALAFLMIAYNFLLPLFMPGQPKRPVNNNAPVNNNVATPPVSNANTAGGAPSGVVGNPVNNGVGPQGPTANNPVVNPVVPTDPNAAAMQAFLNQQQSANATNGSAANAPSSNVSLNLPSVPGSTTVVPGDTKTVTVSTTPTATTTTITPNPTPNVATGPATVAPVEVKPATPTTTVVSVNTPVVDNAASSNMLDSMKSYFDKQFSDVKSDISKFNKDIEKQVEATTALTTTVKDIDARLKKLEGGGGVAKVASSRPARAVSNSRVVRARPQPQLQAQPQPQRSTTVVARNDDTIQIITGRPAKPATSDEQILIVSKADVRKVAPAVRETSNGLITKYKIHSLYAGRVWIANSDNTHSNFSVGDRLPEGEVIRSVDMDKGVISTDRGIIKVY